MIPDDESILDGGPDSDIRTIYKQDEKKMNYIQQCRTCHTNIEGTGADICYGCLQRRVKELEAALRNIQWAVCSEYCSGDYHVKVCTEAQAVITK